VTTTLDTRIAAVGRTGASRTAWGRLLAPIGGLGIVAGLIALMVSPASDDTGETPAEVVAYASSHESWNVAILLFGLASVGLGGLFTAGLYTRLRAAATETQSVLVLIGGIVFALCFALCGSSGWRRSSTCPTTRRGRSARPRPTSATTTSAGSCSVRPA
jgi:hypothetical protein